MTKITISMVVSLLCVCSIANAAVTKIELEISQVLNGVAAYDHTTGIATWSGGGTGWAFDPFWPGLWVFGDVTVSAAFSDVIDQSPGTDLAKAVFSTGGFTITASNIMFGMQGPLNGDITFKAELTGGNLYCETEISPDVIAGQGVVQIAQFNYTGTDYIVEWENGAGRDSIFVADIALNPTTGFADYDTDSYQSNNVIITVFVEEGFAPEPAALALLGLGCMILARRRKRLEKRL